MKSFGLQRSIIGFGLLTLLAGCGGGSGNGNSSGNNAALSADQTASEQFLLAPNASYSLQWALPISGAPVNGVNYLIEAHASMAASPLTAGTQKLNETASTSIANSLGLPTGGAPARYLVNGAILVGASSQSNISYQGTGVRVDQLAVDGVTVVDSTLRTNYSVVPLTGAVAAAPTEFAQFFNALYYNPVLLNASTTWSASAAYVKYTGTQIGDLYTVVDYTGTTTGNAPVPVASGTTIAAMMTAGGITSTTDATIYTLSNGSVSIINGVTTYVASSVRTNLTTPTYRTYYELNGNVYVGSLIRSGTVEGGNPYPVATPGTAGYTVNYTQNYQIRLNAAAVASLHATVTF
jgi:hypothetical protein